jgi:chemotaxis protein MotA
MNISVALGILVGIVVVIGGIFTSTDNWKIFLDIHALLVVVGGTLAATLISFPISQLMKVGKIFWRKVLSRNNAPHIQVIDEIVLLAAGHVRSDDFLQNNLESIKTPFLREAIELQLEGGIPPHKIDSILKKRAEVHFVRYEDEAHIFKTIARFPPAFGLLGAVLGMIALMSGLGSPDSFKTIGPAMAMAMVATMYGIAIANFIFVPLGENLAKLSKEDHLMRSIVLDAIKLLREKEHPVVVEEYLKSYLLSTERQKLAGQKKAA